MKLQGTVEASTCGGMDASLLSQKVEGSLAPAEYLQTATMLCLDVIQSVYDALHDLGTFAFVASYLFSAGGRHLSDFTELLLLIRDWKRFTPRGRG